MSNALVAEGLTKHYGRTVALEQCTFAVPTNCLLALVGPNGAGKSTLLHCATGLVRPTHGTITVLGGPAGDATLPLVGFLAQDAPLYRDFSAEELLMMGARLNRDFDVPFARERLARVGVPLDRRVDRLSGGQRAQVALCLALAKRPRLLLLDEPLASLDPLARREFLSALMDAVAETPATVILSSHLLSDLERVCDHIMVLRGGRVPLLGATDEVLATHKLMVGPHQRRPRLPGGAHIVSVSNSERESHLLVRSAEPILDPAWEQHDVVLEDIILAYLGEGALEPVPDAGVAAP
jgi:ABC-2 type transport system ATP-binding protein